MWLLNLFTVKLSPLLVWQLTPEPGRKQVDGFPWKLSQFTLRKRPGVPDTADDTFVFSFICFPNIPTFFLLIQYPECRQRRRNIDRVILNKLPSRVSGLLFDREIIFEERSSSALVSMWEIISLIATVSLTVFESALSCHL